MKRKERRKDSRRLWACGFHEGFDIWGQCGRIDVNYDGVYMILTAWIYGQAF